MNRYLFVPRVLEFVAAGRSLRTGIAWVLRIGAAGVALFAAITWIGLWALAQYFEAQAVLGLIVFQALFVVTTYAIVHTVLVRATDITRLPDGEVVILPMVGLCCRLLGECLAWFFSALAAGGALLALIAGPAAGMAMNQLPFSTLLGSGVGLVGALLYLISGIALGFASLLFFYWLAESTSLVGAIARNTDILRKAVERYAVPIP